MPPNLSQPPTAPTASTTPAYSATSATAHVASIIAVLAVHSVADNPTTSTTAHTALTTTRAARTAPAAALPHTAIVADEGDFVHVGEHHVHVLVERLQIPRAHTAESFESSYLDAHLHLRLEALLHPPKRPVLHARRQGADKVLRLRLVGSAARSLR